MNVLRVALLGLVLCFALVLTGCSSSPGQGSGSTTASANVAPKGGGSSSANAPKATSPSAAGTAVFPVSVSVPDGAILKSVSGTKSTPSGLPYHFGEIIIATPLTKSQVFDFYQRLGKEKGWRVDEQLHSSDADLHIVVDDFGSRLSPNMSPDETRKALQGSMSIEVWGGDSGSMYGKLFSAALKKSGVPPASYQTKYLISIQVRQYD